MERTVLSFLSHAHFYISYTVDIVHSTYQNNRPALLMAAQNRVPGMPVAVPVAASVPPVPPRTVEKNLIDCGLTTLQADKGIDQGLETCLVIAIMTPEPTMDKLYELKQPPAFRISQEVRLSARHK
jgi:hypothetical protein